MTRVLYVEDESLLAISMEGAMESEGFRVVLAFDGDEGLEKARVFEPEIIITDYMMPRMDGFSMLAKLRAAGITAPAILTTAVPESGLRPDQRAQIDLYVGKPFSEQELISALRRALSAS